MKIYYKRKDGNLTFKTSDNIDLLFSKGITYKTDQNDFYDMSVFEHSEVQRLIECLATGQEYKVVEIQQVNIRDLFTVPEHCEHCGQFLEDGCVCDIIKKRCS